MDDCLCCGGFGVLLPLTIYLSHFEKARAALDARASVRWRAEQFQNFVDEGASRDDLTSNGYYGDGSEASIARMTALYEAALKSKPFRVDDYRPYFDVIVEVLESAGVTLIPLEGEVPE